MANIIIVGAGVAGLTAGIYALYEGHKVTIYERHFKAGGNLTGWDRRGYHIDNCIHWLTGTNSVTAFHKMWVKLGALGDDVEIYQPQSLYTYEKDGKTFSLDKSLAELKANMLVIAPEDKKEILGLIHAIRSVQRLNGMGGKDCERKSNAWEYLVSAPDLLKYGKYTIKDLSERFKNPLLRSFLHSFMSEQFSALAMIMVFATFTGKNGGIPHGSSCAMAERMVARYESLGGVLHLKNGVAKVNVQNGAATSVLLDDGSEVQADYVVITADPAVAFGSLLDRLYMPKKLAEQYADANMIRFACQQCAFAFDGETLPFAGEMIYDVPEQYREILCSDYLMLREFSHEKSFAPEGKCLMQSMAYCLEDDAKALVALYRDKDAYEQRKAKMVEAAEQIICAHLPELKGKITCIDSWTPATYERFVGSQVGSFMSFIMPAGAAPVQLSGKIEGLDNVVIATQWQMAPGGLPIAAMAGIAAVKLIGKRENKKSK